MPPSRLLSSILPSLLPLLPVCLLLQEKVTGLLQRAQFMPCALTGAELEVGCLCPSLLPC